MLFARELGRGHAVFSSAEPEPCGELRCMMQLEYQLREMCRIAESVNRNYISRKG